MPKPRMEARSSLPSDSVPALSTGGERGSETKELSPSATHPGGDRIRLGKRYCMWKPGGRPISGYLLGISGLRMVEGGVKETLIIRTDVRTDVYDWDATKKEAVRRDSINHEDVAVFLTAGLESLRAYAIDPTGIRHVFIPSGKKIKLSGNRTFWQFVSEDPQDAITLDVSVSKWKRSAKTIVQQVVAKPKEESGDDPPMTVEEESPVEDFDNPLLALFFRDSWRRRDFERVSPRDRNRSALRASPQPLRSGRLLSRAERGRVRAPYFASRIPVDPAESRNGPGLHLTRPSSDRAPSAGGPPSPAPPQGDRSRSLFRSG